VTDRLRLATGTAEVLASLRRSLTGNGVTAALPPTGPERQQTLTMLHPEQPVAEADAAAVVATSGSTGRPRGVVLSRSALVASAEATHARLGGAGSWVLALPPHYVAGLMVLVRAAVGGRSVHEVEGRLSGLTDLRLGDGPAYLSVVPTQLTRALADPALTRALRRFDAVLLGGAAADPQMLETAAESGIRVVTTYGMSETCGGCVYDGRPLADVDIDLDDAGRISIGGPTVFAGYRLDPVATAEALVEGRLVTRDRGAFVDGRLTVLGRLDDVVISGGMNVDLAVVERAVRTWAAREGAEAAVVGVPDPDWGTQVVAVVEDDEQNLPHVPTSPPDLSGALQTRGRFSSASLHDALAADLPRFAQPRRLLVVRTLPRTSSGKIDRRRLIAELTVDQATPTSDPNAGPES